MPKRTWNPKKKKRATTHGFRTRMKTPGGKKILKYRRLKRRRRLAVQGKRKK